MAESGMGHVELIVTTTFGAGVWTFAVAAVFDRPDALALAAVAALAALFVASSLTYFAVKSSAAPDAEVS